MLVAVIKAINVSDAISQIRLITHRVDAIELRLDYWCRLDLADVAKLRKIITLPIIFTLRKKSQGGQYAQSEQKRLKAIETLCEFNPEYVDLEYDIEVAFIAKLYRRFPQIKFICSYHNFENTLENLDEILPMMHDEFFYMLKIVTFANSTVDALRMLSFVAADKNKKITGICMGELGQVTRILAPIVGSAFNYVVSRDDLTTAPGQLTLHELEDVYHYSELNAKTKIFALLGDPVDKSVGHILYNQGFKKLQLNAIYLKLKVTEDQLPMVMNLCRQLPFNGLSVTMPLKSAVIPLLDEIDVEAHKIGAVNTIIRNKNRWVGANTDGIGAIAPLMKRINLSGKNITILGAGGAAKAIAYQAIKQGAIVTLLNRSIDKALNLAKHLHCNGDALTEFFNQKDEGSHVLINTLPFDCDHLFTRLNAHFLSRITIVMDIIYNPRDTVLLKKAAIAGCHCIPGYQMYIHQALQQFRRWFELSEQQLADIQAIFERYFIKS